MLLYLRTTYGSSAALGESSIRLGARWKTLIEPVLPLMSYMCLIRKCATVLQRKPLVVQRAHEAMHSLMSSGNSRWSCQNCTIVVGVPCTYRSLMGNPSHD